jgi:hypothetical protein
MIKIVSIEHQDAQLGFHTSQPSLALKSTPPALELRTVQPEFRHRRADAELHIDQTQCFADVSLRKLVPFALYSRDLAIQKTKAATVEISQEGDQLGAIEKGVTVVDLARREWDDALREFGLELVPEHRPQIQVDVQPLEMSYTPGSVNLNFRPGDVQGHMTYGQVQGYYRQQRYINIDFVPYHFLNQLG